MNDHVKSFIHPHLSMWGLSSHHDRGTTSGADFPLRLASIEVSAVFFGGFFCGLLVTYF